MSVKTRIDEITIEGITYVPKGSDTVKNTEGLRYVLVRSQTAGVFVGYLQSQVGQHVTLLNCKRIWYWSGAASISQLAVQGTKKPTECKIPTEVSKQDILQVIEVLDVTEKAKASLDSVKEWSA